MNSKAIRKQLLAAVAMVLVAAVALGSSTYAWFVASGTVTAKGMNVQAQSDGGLVINYHGGTWGATATADPSDLRDLSPASTRDLKTWFSATALGPDATKYKANLDEVDDISSEFTHDTGKDEKDKAKPSTYGMLKYFEIRSATKQNVPKGLYVKEIKVTNPDGTVPDQYMSTALRVGIECVYGSGDSEKTYNIYAPVSLGSGTNNNPTTTYPVLQKKSGSDGFEYGSNFTVTPIGDNTKAIVPGSVTIPVSGAIEVYIYVWFEGEDANLYSDNFYAEPLNVTVSFTSITNDGTVPAETQGS